MLSRLIHLSKLSFATIINWISSADVYYVIESKDWAIKEIGNNICDGLRDNKTKVRLTLSPYGIRNSIVHFGSINCYCSSKRIRQPHASNKVVVTWYHVVEDDPRIILYNLSDLKVDVWHTSCESTRAKLVRLGISKPKIQIVPIPVDLSEFNLKDKYKIRKKLRLGLGISDSDFVIGSFQKDGEGWGDGDKPKLIKGPDKFIEVVEALKSHEKNVVVLLTGPARGYVKNGLKKLGIRFFHIKLPRAVDVAQYYHALDAYLVASREEGGPRALLESLATGTPLVTTSVGMAPDLYDEKSYYIANENSAIVEALLKIKHAASQTDIEHIDGMNPICMANSNFALAPKYVELWNTGCKK